MASENDIRKVGIYARQSSGVDDPGDSVSLNVQIDRLTELAESKHWEVVVKESDPNISGRTYPDTPEARVLAATDAVFQKEVASKPEGKRFREGLARLLAFLAEVDAVLVWDNTRLMRPLTSSYLEPFIAQQFVRADTLLYTSSEGVFDFQSFQNLLVSAIDNRVQDNILQENKRKTEAGRKKLRDAGMLWNGSVVNSYGYTQSGKQCVRVVQEEADVVRQVFKWFVDDGMAIQGIAKRLNAEKIPTRTRKKPRRDKRHVTSIWRSDSVRNMLRRHHYAGFDFDSRGRKVEIVPLRGKTIISEAMYYRARAILDSHERFGSYQTKVIHPLTGLLYCGYCGGRMHRGDHGSYGCHDNLSYKSPTDATTAGCRLTRIRETASASFHRWRYTGLLEALQPLLTLTLAEHQGRELEAIDGQLGEIREALAGVEQQEREIGERIITANLPAEQVVIVLEPLARRRKELDAKILEAEGVRAQMLSARPTSELRAAIRDISSGRLLDLDLYRDLARRVFQRIEVFGDRVGVVFTDGSGFTLPRFQLGRSRTLPLPVTLLSWEGKAIGSARSCTTTREDHAAVVYLQRDSQRQGLKGEWIPTPPGQNTVLYDNGGLLVELSP
jgi:DNA invertase Pin-like site-specific DNA recombinase